MHEYSIPERIRQGLDRYVNDGMLPGGFLQAVLSNDLMSAVFRADPDSYGALREIVRYVYDKVPWPCHGSRKAMLDWCDKKRAERPTQIGITRAQEHGADFQSTAVKEEKRHEDSAYSGLASR